MFNSHPLIARLLLFIIAPSVALGFGGVMYLRQSLPEDRMELLTGVTRPVTITRDTHGIVHVRASVDRDAFYALGYSHAQDRMWQLELQRRIASGRLSEVLGRDATANDVWMRTLGLYPAAQQAWVSLSKPAQEALSAYAAGVNAWLSSTRVLPVEFILLDVQPKPWTEIDSLAWAKVFALSLGRNFRTEIENFAASQFLNSEELLELRGISEPELRAVGVRGVSVGTALSLLSLQQDIQNSLRIGGRYVGSNAWVIGSKCTAGHGAIIANDAHLDLQIPSLWYGATLKGDRLDVAGMTLVGLPVVIFGRNADIAWAGTNMMADAQDLYAQQINPHKPSQYLWDEAWHDMSVRTETIRIRSEFPSFLRPETEPLKIQVRSTRAGPIISDAVRGVGQPLALHWVALDANDTSFEAFLRLNYARDWMSFREALRLHVAPALNFLFADEEGNVGFTAAGKIPVRKVGEGRLPLPGWSSGYEWNGFISFDQLPRQYNPPNCYIISANDKNPDVTYEATVLGDWAAPFRARRVRQLIEEKVAKAEPVSLDDVERIQGDTFDLGARGLLAFLRSLDLEDARKRRAIELLRSWDGDMSADSQAAAIFFVWAKYLRKELFGTPLRAYRTNPQSGALESIIDTTSYDQILHAVSGSDVWCDQQSSTTSCSVLLREALDKALAELTRLLGSNMDGWNWGRLHHAFYSHTPFSQMGTIASLFERRLANGGAPDSINAASARFIDAKGYEQTNGPGFRQIIQLGKQPSHRYMNSTGQSGNVLSRHYADMVVPFRDVRYFEFGCATAFMPNSCAEQGR